MKDKSKNILFKISLARTQKKNLIEEKKKVEELIDKKNKHIAQLINEYENMIIVDCGKK